MASLLPRDFYERSTLAVARELLGARLVRVLDGMRLSGIIIETEAYLGEQDLGSHARAGRTQRTAVMYGQAGHAYVYFTYGMHWCLNAVTEAEETAGAVLLRAIEASEGAEVIRARRKGRDLNGPAKLTQALGVDGSLNRADLTSKRGSLWIEAGHPIPDERVTMTARVGLYSVPEPWKSMPWRFRIKDQ